MTPDDVVAATAAAVPVDPVPASHLLINHHCPECLEVSEAFGCRRWTEVTLDHLRAAAETALLTPTAWRYYVPAVISWVVRAPDELDLVPDNLVYQLEPRWTPKTGH